MFFFSLARLSVGKECTNRLQRKCKDLLAVKLIESNRIESNVYELSIWIAIDKRFLRFTYLQAMHQELYLDRISLVTTPSMHSY